MKAGINFFVSVNSPGFCALLSRSSSSKAARTADLARFPVRVVEGSSKLILIKRNEMKNNKSCDTISNQTFHERIKKASELWSDCIVIHLKRTKEYKSNLHMFTLLWTSENDTKINFKIMRKNLSSLLKTFCQSLSGNDRKKFKRFYMRRRTAS